MGPGRPGGWKIIIGDTPCGLTRPIPGAQLTRLIGHFIDNHWKFCSGPAILNMNSIKNIRHAGLS